MKVYPPDLHVVMSSNKHYVTDRNGSVRRVIIIEGQPYPWTKTTERDFRKARRGAKRLKRAQSNP